MESTLYAGTTPGFSLEPDTALLALDEALNALAEFDQQQSRIVELRYF